MSKGMASDTSVAAEPTSAPICSRGPERWRVIQGHGRVLGGHERREQRAARATSAVRANIHSDTQPGSGGCKGMGVANRLRRHVSSQQS